MKTLTEKKCTSCSTKANKEVLLSLEAFGKRKNSSDGLADQCKKCINEYQQNRVDKLKALKISEKEAKFLENQMNGLHKTTDTINVVKEEKQLDEALLVAVRPFFYYLLSLKVSKEGDLILDIPPHKFCQTFFPNVPHAGLQLFNTFVERTKETYKFKRKVVLPEMAKEFATLITLSSLIKVPSPRVIAQDISDLREMMMHLKTSVEKIIS